MQKISVAILTNGLLDPSVIPGGVGSGNLGVLYTAWSFSGAFSPRIGTIPFLSPSVTITPTSLTATLGVKPSAATSGSSSVVFQLSVNDVGFATVTVPFGSKYAELTTFSPTTIAPYSVLTADVISIPTGSTIPVADATIQLWFKAA